MTYAHRNAILRSLGFATYPAYLSSLRWQAIRARILARSRQCHTCHRPATEVHHSHYTPANLSGESSDGLFPLCADCHDLIEFHAGQKILDLREITRRWQVLQTMGYTQALLRMEGIDKRAPYVRTNNKAGQPRETLTGIKIATAIHPRKKPYRSKWHSRH